MYNLNKGINRDYNLFHHHNILYYKGNYYYLEFCLLQSTMYKMWLSQYILSMVKNSASMNFPINNVSMDISKEELMLNPSTHPNNFNKQLRYCMLHMRDSMTYKYLNYHNTWLHIHSFPIHLQFYLLLCMRYNKLMKCIRSKEIYS